MECAHDHVDKDQHSAHNNSQFDPEVLHTQGKEGNHGAHETKNCGQLSHEKVLLHDRLAGGPQAVALAAGPGDGNLRYSGQYSRQDSRQDSGQYTNRSQAVQQDSVKGPLAASLLTAAGLLTC